MEKDLRKGLERSRGGQPQTAAAAAAATTSTCSTHGKDQAETGEATKLRTELDHQGLEGRVVAGVKGAPQNGQH